MGDLDTIQDHVAILARAVTSLRDVERGEIFESGFVREGSNAYNPTAVRWWLIAIDADGFLFARGGRVSDVGAASSEIAGARPALDRERHAWRHRSNIELVGNDLVRRFTHELGPNGELLPLVPTDFESGGT